MSHSRLWVLATIIALAIILGFFVSVPHTQDVAKAPAEIEIQTSPAVSITDSFKKGVHTITGSLIVPNACTAVTARAAQVDSASSTSDILVELSFPEDAGICLQLQTRATFSVKVDAPARLPISVTVNGVAASIAP